MPEDLLKKFEQHLTETITTLDAKLGLQKNTPDLYGALLAEILPDGKRLRPMLLLSTINGYGGELDQAAYGVAVSLELLHTFALIHDDIIDESPERRGRPALALALETDPPKKGKLSHGIKRAILGGDIVYTLALTVFEEAVEKHPKATPCRSLLFETAARTGMGVFTEVSSRANDMECLTSDFLTSLFDRKTSLYSFVLPLKLGALLAGAPERELPILEDFGRNLGRAYQTRDDLRDLDNFINHDAEIISSEFHLNLPVLLAYEAGDDKDRRKLARLMAKDQLKREERKSLQALLSSTSALAQAELMFAKNLCQAQEAAGRLDMPPDSYTLIDKFTASLFAENGRHTQYTPCPH